MSDFAATPLSANQAVSSGLITPRLTKLSVDIPTSLKN
jgi:hypothetical protein